MESPSRTRRSAGSAFRLAVDGVGAGWFTSVMGTGILAICLTLSPVPIPFAHPVAVALFAGDALLFVSLVALWTVAVLRDAGSAFDTLFDPVKAQVWGAPPMACFTIAVGALRIGETFAPEAVCVAVAQTLFFVGVAASLFSMFVVPYLMFTRHELTQEKTFGSWLLPVVPPIVASAPAALLSPTWPQAVRGDVLAFAYALLGTGILLAAIVIVVFYSRLLYSKVPEGALVTTTWLVIGPLGQSIAGTIALGTVAAGIWPAFGPGLQVAGLMYGLLVWGFGMYWLAMAIALTLRARERAIPFNLGWWAFTFPVGVLTTGTYALFGLTHARLFAVVGVALLALLAAMWLLVATKTVRGAWRAIASGGPLPSATPGATTAATT